MSSPALPVTGAARQRRLSTRIAALFLGLLLLVQLAGFAAIRASTEASAQRTLTQELQVGERIWLRLLDNQSQRLVQGSTLLAADWGFREAVAASDRETLDSAVENHMARIGATVGAWVGTDLQVGVSRDARGQAHQDSRLRQLATDMASAGRSTQVLRLGNRVLQFVAVPLKAPRTIGWLVLGFELDQALADDMKALSGLDVALATPGQPAQVLLSTLPQLKGPELASATTTAVQLGGEAWQLRRVAVGQGELQAQVLLLRSVDEALAPWRRIQLTLALITAVGVVVFGVGSMLTARRVTTPLQALAVAAGRLGQGRYDEPVQHTERPDEVGQLAQAFDHMRVSIARHQAEIHDLAFRDRLTGLPNRAQFRADLQAALPRASADQPLAVLMFGLNRFKHVNDLLGYAFGDRLLQAVAQRLADDAARHGERVARLGSDEFAVLLTACSVVQAQHAAQRLADALEQPLSLDGQLVDVSAAFGVACAPTHATDADALLSRAEVAMYAAKRKTVPCVVYDPAIDSASTQTLSLLSELRRALDRDELRLFLQPKIALKSGAFIAAEALVRWQHPTRGMVPPLQFIPFAEQTGFVSQLTLWMFEACVRQWPQLQALGLQRVSVNLSTRDLLDLELPQRLQAILQRHDVPPTVFCLEITESAIMDEPQRALGILEALSAMGFKLSIDDFGTGYSSLAYLKRLPVDELKIDKSFVMAMERDLDDAKIVRSTIDLAHNLGLTVVAEGIENATIWSLLKALGCDEGQGYHMCRPLPADEMPAFAERWAGTQAPATILAELG